MSPGISGLLAWRVPRCHVLGQFAEEAEAALAADLREVPDFPLRTTPPFQLDQSIFLSSPSPRSGSHIQNKFPPTPASWGPVLHPAADLLLLPVLFPLWRADCQDRQKSRAGPGPEMQRAWRRMGGSSLLLAFLALSRGQHPDHPLVHQPLVLPSSLKAV